ncbi:hypothetical protein STAFG_0727 [Streptomyces afghaniensis 772]|uniref:Uncharacterized protein n=1 Tax=Streptomyces afghaniensis 772 TaxID=1283301 RepID=S4N0T9_9ACTN|nr:hypothetical protein STAFG_0727 [Streptomyces afghaniensis 772]
MPGRHSHAWDVTDQQRTELIGSLVTLRRIQALQQRLDAGMPGGFLADPHPLHLGRVSSFQSSGGLVKPLEFRPLPLGVAPCEPARHR